MFKHAYCRGIQNALIQGGHVAFPSELDAAKVADYIADHVNIDPLQGPIPREVTAKLAEYVIAASNECRQQGLKTASFNKLSSMDDLNKLASQHALHVMELAEKQAEGSTIEGGDKGNKAMSSAEAKMDARERPPGYADDSLGKTELDTRPGAVGKEYANPPKKPSESPSGTNSVIEQSKTSSLSAMIRKLAEGTTILGGDKGNKERTTAEGDMDERLRPPGYAVLPHQGALGELMGLYDNDATVGKEIPNPAAPSESPSGTNSVIETSQKSAEEAAWMSVFKKTANEIIQYLPGSLHETAKIAHVKACMGLSTREKAQYLTSLQKEAVDTTTRLSTSTRNGEHTSEKTHSRPGAYDGRNANQATKKAELPDFMKKDEKSDEKKDEDKEEKKDDDKGGMPPWLKNKVDDKAESKAEGKAEGKAEEKSEEKAEEKKEEEKSAALRQHIRRIQAALHP